jgi:hypothetical protein
MNNTPVDAHMHHQFVTIANSGISFDVILS